jgi:hypothetical protein
VIRALAVVTGIAAVAAFGFDRLPGEMRDFEVYWTAADRATRAEPLYRAADGHFQFKYLPAFAVLTAPAGLMPLATAKAAWFTSSAALLVTFVWLSVAILPARRRPAWLLATVAVVAMAKFYGHELVLGQVNILFGVLVAGALLLLKRERDVAATLLIVAAVVVKPYAVLLLPWVAFVRGRPALAAGAAGMAAVLLVPAVLYGGVESLELHREWWRTVTGSTAPNLTNNDNVSLAGLSAKWLGPGSAAAVLTLTGSICLLGGIAFAILRRRGIAHPETLEGALLLTAVPLLSPQGWDYVLLIATPAVMLFANDDDRLPPVLRWATWAAIAVTGLSLFDLMGRERYAAFMSWSVITVCVMILVAALVTLRARRIA